MLNGRKRMVGDHMYHDCVQKSCRLINKVSCMLSKRNREGERGEGREGEGEGEKRSACRVLMARPKIKWKYIGRSDRQ